MFFISGVFWQECNFPTQGNNNQKIDQNHFYFHGFINRTSSENNHGASYLTDMFGDSEIPYFELDDPHLYFTKRYRGTAATFVYELRKKSTSHFAGYWEMLESGIIITKGEATCLLSPLDETLFVRPYILTTTC